jgi:signal transduction histidine kinase
LRLGVAGTAGGSIAVTVEDGGPGFGEAAPALDRTGSTNLGLAIAERLAVASGGSLVRARSPMGGALVTLTLGPAGD